MFSPAPAVYISMLGRISWEHFKTLDIFTTVSVYVDNTLCSFIFTILRRKCVYLLYGVHCILFGDQYWNLTKFMIAWCLCLYCISCQFVWGCSTGVVRPQCMKSAWTESLKYVGGWIRLIQKQVFIWPNHATWTQRHTLWLMVYMYMHPIFKHQWSYVNTPSL